VTADELAARLSGRAGEVALCLDFDGTLAPIVDDPDAARPLPGDGRAARPAGRPVRGRRPGLGAPGRLPRRARSGTRGALPGDVRAGGGPRRRVRVDPRLAAGRPAVAAAREDLRADAAVRDSGAHLEDKGYAVAVHTRRIADPPRWAAVIDRTAREIAARHGLEVVPGKLVWELRPPVHSDKGDAVRRVVADSGARSVVVAGDDLGDLAAFATAARIAGGLRVAVRSAEAPPDLLAEADLVVEDPTGLREFLQRLVE
jgi:trehalose 6-phosphate phosphatase